MYKLAAMGDRESVLGFKALGLDVFVVEDVVSARTTLDHLAKEEYAIIYITEPATEGIESEIAKYTPALVPAIIPIPSKSGGNGMGMRAIHDAVERAVGADILGDK